MDDVLNYLKEEYPDLKVLQDTFGLVDKDQYICLAKDKSVADRLLVIIDMNEPKQSIILPITDTIAYWAARYILAYHSNARRYASKRASEVKGKSNDK